MEKKTVKINNAGCAIFPSGSIHRVTDYNEIAYNAEIKDFLIKDWCANVDSNVPTIKDEFGIEYTADTVLFGKNKYQNGISLNKFFSLGYYAGDGMRTGHFANVDYDFFEDYIQKNQNKLFVGTCDYSSYKKVLTKG